MNQEQMAQRQIQQIQQMAGGQSVLGGLGGMIHQAAIKTPSLLESLESMVKHADSLLASLSRLECALVRNPEPSAPASTLVSEAVGAPARCDELHSRLSRMSSYLDNISRSVFVE